MSAILLLVVFFSAGHIETGEGKACATRMNLLFIADGSASVCNVSDDLTNPKPCKEWFSLRRFMHKVVNELNVGFDETRVAMISFGGSVVVNWNLLNYTDKADLQREILNLYYPGGDLSGDKILGATRVFTEIFNPATPEEDRPNVTNVIIMACDGIPNYDESATAGMAAITELLGIRSFVVCTRSEDCIKNQYARPKSIASPPNPPFYNQTVWIVDSYDALDAVREPMLVQICSLLENDAPISPSVEVFNAVIAAAIEAAG